MCKNVFLIVLILDFVFVEFIVKIFLLEDGENVVRMICVFDVLMLLYDIWNIDIFRVEFLEIEIGDDNGRLVSMGVELIFVINRNVLMGYFLLNDFKIFL